VLCQPQHQRRKTPTDQHPRHSHTELLPAAVRSVAFVIQALEHAVVVKVLDQPRRGDGEGADHVLDDQYVSGLFVKGPSAVLGFDLLAGP